MRNWFIKFYWRLVFVFTGKSYSPIRAYSIDEAKKAGLVKYEPFEPVYVNGKLVAPILDELDQSNAGTSGPLGIVMPPKRIDIVEENAVRRAIEKHQSSMKDFSGYADNVSTICEAYRKVSPLNVS